VAVVGRDYKRKAKRVGVLVNYDTPWPAIGRIQLSSVFPTYINIPLYITLHSKLTM